MTSSGVHGDIRQSKHHDSAAKHVSGRAVYVDDMATPANCLTVLDRAKRACPCQDHPYGFIGRGRGAWHRCGHDGGRYSRGE